MQFELIRQSKTELSYGGEILIDGEHECWTIENLRRAIPVGRYPLSITFSAHFKRPMPLIDVPGRFGIRIHPANWPRELEGCIAPGETHGRDYVASSRMAFAHLYRKIESAVAAGSAFIQVTEEFNGI